MTGHVQRLHSPETQVSTVWHPEASGEIVGTTHGNIRASIGPAQYQLTTGEIHPI